MQLEWRFAFRDLELKCTDNHGKTCWVSISGEPIYDKYDEFKGYRGITRDITQRKFAEAIAQASKDFHNDKDDDEYTFDNDIAEREPIANSLLAAVPRKDYLNLLAGLTPVTLTYGQVLYEPGQLIEHVYFPSDCLISLLTTVDGNRALGVGLIGREGMLGIPLALGIEFSSVRTLVQASGTAMRMNAACFRNEVADSLPLQQELHRFIHRKLAHARQNAACNRFHVLEERLARWLLMTSDRLCSDQFHLTHAFLANMLGVHRAGVTQAAFTLQQRKLITYRRGNISILDRQGLEAASCGCYQINKPA